ncbi:TonB-dependent receptor plug domain-containing protein [Pseudemcibacter aquimaris]|uniref:TonB-dependent receptor plug domain-containing protein n=4 Tax=Pseudemcibacter aquimaris TaxID=2857064 RepID=UPI00237DE619|nr:TonB-dependent receptor [Pseudemcibacter aquimaris]WDU59078.1 TonB-dependent receptor [Pseudemcibacter aquimaris]
MKKLLLLSASLPALVIADMAVAQDGQEEDTITVVGSRVKGRTALDSNVPVDVIQAAELQATPSLNMKDAMQAVSPSYSVERDAISDGDSLVRSSSLRGLHQGEVLTLLNGKRMHRSAIITYGGWQAADVGSLSVNALKSLEILRDGAAAQYGADAVAGVVNLTLDDSEGISAEANFGQYYEGDGFSYVLASKAGISLADRGFLTVTASYGATDPTDRATNHLFALDHIEKYNAQEAHVSAFLAANSGATRNDALLDWGNSGEFADQFFLDGESGYSLPGMDGSQGWQYEFADPGDLDPDTVAPYGINRETQFTVTWNSEMEIGENSSVYAFGNFSRKYHKEPFNYRPSFPSTYRSGAGGAGATFDGSTRDNFGVFDVVSFDYNSYRDAYGQAAADQYSYLLRTIAPQAPLHPSTLNPNGGFQARNIHPNGFTPWFEMDSQDLGSYLGFKGELDNGLGWDIWGSVGRNRVDNYIYDTANPSMGAPMNDDGSINYGAAPTAFYIGSLVNIERQVGADFVYTVDTDAVENLNVAFGGTYRTDQYYKITGAGEIERSGRTYSGWGSWRPGPLAGDLNVGSDGFGGFAPGVVFDARRSNWAAYLDIDADVTEDFNIAIAGRYEDFTDFGDNFSWKIATRYQLIEDTLAFRGAASTGFHAPTVGQINNTQVRTGFRADGTQTQSGTFVADSPVAQIFGGVVLGPELARNLSAGFVWTPGDDTNITVDFFQIKLRNSITDSPTFDRDDYPAEFAQIEALGIPGAETLNRVDFLVNEGARRVRGIEIVATHNIDLEDSTLRLTAAYAHVKLNVTEHAMSDYDLFNEENLNNFPHKATFTANWNMDNVSVMGRARWWSTMRRVTGFDNNGDYIGTTSDLSAYRVDENPSRVYFDLAITYDVDEQFSVTIGADNIMNTFPKKNPEVVERSGLRGRQYMDFGGMDWMGGKYYARVKANF